jgi:hypothetical protein
MKYGIAGLLLLALIFAALLGRRDGDELREVNQRYSILQAKYAAAVLHVQHDSVEVVRWATKTKTLRDSVLVHTQDTLLIQRFVYQTDTLRESCLRCTESAARFRVSADSAIDFWQERYRRSRPGFRNRFGMYAGYGVSGGQDHQARLGWQMGIGLRVFP